MTLLRALILLPLLGGCSLTRMAINTQAPLLEKGAEALKAERSWQWFKEATPGNIQLIEGLLSQDPDNEILQRSLIRSYAGYSYLVFESELIPEQIDGGDDKPMSERAIGLYRRALKYGEKYFANRGVDCKQESEAKLREQLEKNVRDEDMPALAFFAQAWGASINLQKQNMALLAELPRVKFLFDFVCARRPDIEQGMCPLFYAQYEASRPRMLGGNPELGREMFLNFLQKNPSHLLARVSYLQYSVIARLDEDEFAKEGLALERLLQAWRTGDAGELNLLNATAEKRWELLKARKAKIF